MLCGRHIGKQWFVRFASIYEYAGDIAAAIAALGIGTPVLDVYLGKTLPGANSLDIFHTAFSSTWFYAGLVALAGWVIARVIMKRENLSARAVLAKEFERNIKSLYRQLYLALPEPDPISRILEIQKMVDGRVDDAIRNAIWLYDPPIPPDNLIEAALKEAVNDIRVKYMRNWAPPPAGVP